MITIFEKIACSPTELAILNLVEQNAGTIKYGHGTSYQHNKPVSNTRHMSVYNDNVWLNVDFTEYTNHQKPSVSYFLAPRNATNRDCEKCNNPYCLFHNGKISGKDTRFAHRLYKKMMRYYVALNGYPTY